MFNRVPRRLRRLQALLNWPFAIGTLLAIALIGMCIAAPLLSPYDPTEPVIRYNSGQMIPFPYPPGTPGLPLGTDSASRDLLSRVAYGGRVTLTLCLVAAALRMLIGVALGLAASWYRALQPVCDLLITIFSSLPGLLIAISIIPLIQLGSGSSLLAFTVAAGVTGWAEIAVRCRSVVASIQARPFIEAAQALGVSRRRVLWRHILPNLRNVLVIEAASAMAGTLLVVAELGALFYFIGGSQEAVSGSLRPEQVIAEWGGMLANGLGFRNLGWWLLVVPFTAFTLSILSFSLIAEGLRRR